MDERKMNELLYEKLKVVYSYLLKMGATKEDAEDIIQDTNSYSIWIQLRLIM